MRGKLLCFLLFVAISFGHARDKFNKRYEQIDTKHERGYYKKAPKLAQKILHSETNKTKANTARLVYAYASLALDAYKFSDFEGYESAIKQAEEQFLSLPKDSLDQRIFAGRELAETYLKLGNYQKALFFAEQAYVPSLKRAPNDICVKRVANTYLHILIENGFLNKAQEVFETHFATFDKFIADQQVVTNRRGEKVVANTSKKEAKLRRSIYVEFTLNKARLLTKKGENAQSIQFIFDNMDAFADKEQFVKACKELGDALFGLNEYVKAEDYYHRATKASKISNHSDFEIYCRRQLNRTYVLLDQNKDYKKNNRKLNHATQYFPSQNVLRLLPVYNNVMRYSNQERFSKAANAYKELQEEISLSKIYHSDPFNLEMQELQNLILLKTYQTKELVDATINLYTEYEKIYSKDAPELHFKRMGLAGIYTNFTNDFSKSATIFDTSFKKYVQVEYSSIHPVFHTFLSTKGDYFDLNENYDSASFYYNKAAESVNECFGDYSAPYVLELEKSANMFINIGDYPQAKTTAELAKKMIRKAEGDKKQTSIETYQTLGRIYQTLGMYGDAKSAYKKAYSLSHQLKYEREINVARSADEKAKILIETGNYSDAEQLLLNSYQTKKERFGDDSKELIATHHQLGNLYLIVGKYSEAEKQLLTALEITDKVFGVSSLKYAEILLSLEKLHVALGDLDKSMVLVQQALGITTAKLGQNHIKTAEVINEIAFLKYYEGNKDEEVEQHLQKAMEINKALLSDQHPRYAENLNTLAQLKIQQLKYKEASNLLEQSQKIWTDKLGKNNVHTAHIELLEGDLAKYNKNYEDAEQHYNTAKQIFTKQFSNTHPNYVKTLSKLGQIYFAQGKYDKSLKVVEKTTQQYLDFTNKYFKTLSFDQKTKFWNTIKGDFEFFNTLAYKLLPTQPEITGSMYDHIIQTKHILMGNSSKVLQAILESNDEGVISQYKELILKRTQLTNHLVNGSDEEGFNLEQLENDIENLEKKLSEASAEFRKSSATHQEKTVVSWRDVQQKLKPNEYAVEILRYRNFEDDFTDSVVYAALILSPEVKTPKFVKLKYGNKLEKRFLNYYRNAFVAAAEDKYSYEVFWSDIKANIPTGAKIYLSPEGVFDQLNIETFFNKQSKEYAIDENDLILLSNTKELVTEALPTSNLKKYAILCGNPEFYPVSKTEGHIPQLKGAEHEVQTISNILTQNGWNTHVIMYATADRDSLFSQSVPTVFHIATHGYFKQDLYMREGLDNNSAHILQNPLLRSGILLKGAGDALENNDKKSIGGIFTAYEAMNMNFSNTELIVLSACETARGDVLVGEGVQGLQMGLFVSGARNLIMSLFKVPDDITDRFMTLFYQKWMLTNDLEQSFRNAVKDVRQEHKDPRDWGSFILVRK